MDFTLTKEQEMFRDMAKEFAEREVVPSVQERDREERFFPEIMQKMANQGFFAIKVPQEMGGLGLDWTTMGLVAEQIAAVDFSVALTFYIQTSLEIMPILIAGTEEQKKKFIPDLMTGKKIGCLAAVEPNAGSDATSVQTTAVPDGNEWVLNGNKSWITNATVSDYSVVLAQADKSKGTKGIATFIVENGMPGYSKTKISHKLGCRSSDTGQLFFRDCRIPKDNLLGAIGKGMATALQCIEFTRFGISCMAVGVTQACIDASIKYALERKQFGRPIGSNQLIQEQIADMIVGNEASRWLSYHVAYMKDQGITSTRETGIAKYHNMDVAMKATRTALEIHGAYALTDDFPMERFYRDMTGPLIFGGTANVQRLVIGRFALGIDAFR
ncbi:MAG: acyl-CoA dehydrogenase family protein [Smithellaceae bacterium]|jgi:alkylation response protein AidB-like acyl-CoA dehydrogenase